MSRVWVRRRKDRPGRPWVCAWDGPDGKRHQQKFESEESAEQFKATKTLDLGQAAPPSMVDLNVTVRAFGEKWLRNAEAGLKRKTIRSYDDTLRHHVYPAFGAAKVREIHQQHVAAFLAAKLTEKDARGGRRYKLGTVRLMYATLRRLLSRAVFEGIVQKNAAAAVWKELPVPAGAKRKKGRLSKDAVKAMDEKQQAAFMAQAVKDPRHFALFLTLGRTGLRIGEALGLHLTDADPDAAELHVRRTLADAGGGLTLEERVDTPKSDETRAVELGVEVTESLRRHITRRLEQNLCNGWTQERSPWLFVTEEGTPMDASRVRVAFAAVLRKAGLPLRFTPHSLRHSYATLMLAKYI